MSEFKKKRRPASDKFSSPEKGDVLESKSTRSTRSKNSGKTDGKCSGNSASVRLANKKTNKKKVSFKKYSWISFPLPYIFHWPIMVITTIPYYQFSSFGGCGTQSSHSWLSVILMYRACQARSFPVLAKSTLTLTNTLPIHYLVSTGSTIQTLPCFQS